LLGSYSGWTACKRRSESSNLENPRLLTSHVGSSGVDVWNLNDESKVMVPAGAGDRGDTTAIVWIWLLIVWKEIREEKKVCHVSHDFDLSERYAGDSVRGDLLFEDGLSFRGHWFGL
jgi:hypothetical protein